ncbi:NADH:ubiquinone reductase (Na(+)-transporting) subunit F [Psychrobacter immobilis]|jgi:phenol hydroxylase P5 protein|uniref:NADH:ubiquinone reductase (Na(+)-transporting) subunit F n=1 Tax=Psychrobacter immobilis TaxID=498 RepID=UPI001919579B|nr:2Fe-2S iron-sulfur cluster binding domain-containing protein [Psychrobacter immobilis]
MSYEVTIEPTGDVIEVEDGQTLLQAALRQGVWLPFACGHGTCGTCKVQVLEGFVDHGEASTFALMEVERDEGKVLACCCYPESDLVVEADIDVDPDFLGYAVKDYNATVVDMTPLSPTILGIRLQLDDDMEFQAGQYVNLYIPDVGSRAFSISNPPSQSNIIELHVRLVPDGKGTMWLHNELSVGDKIDVSGPYGQFFVRSSDSQDVIFIAGGSGLSSPESMIYDLLEKGDNRQIYLFQGARNIPELYHREKFEQLAQDNDNFHYIPALSDEDTLGEWLGFKGYVNDAVKQHFNGKCSGHKAYMCGPPPMIDATITTLMQSRLFERDIHMERFLTAADGSSESSRSALFKRI